MQFEDAVTVSDNASPSPETWHWNLADSPSSTDMSWIGDRITGGDSGTPTSGETTSETDKEI